MFFSRLRSRSENRPSHGKTPSRQPRRKRTPQPQVELLETRDLPTVFAPSFVLHQAAGSVAPLATAGPTGYTPTQIRQAYGFNQISFNGVAGDGSGTTIAIVDAYDDPNIASDLHQFDLQFSLPDPTFTKVNQSGGSTMPTADTGWAQEISLDVEWAHAIAPKANILLVEANDSSETNLFTAVSYAAHQAGVVAVSMSWGGGEFSSESSYDGYFQTPSGHAGVAFVASSGDAGAPVSYPAASPDVLSVGGTTLNLSSTGGYLSESGWSGSGGGISSYESQPSYQNGVVTQSTTRRTNPDVSYDADPNTGFPVYLTYGNSASTPWLQFGGTSDAAPQWAALVAIADQGRALQGLGSLDTATQLLPMLYKLPSSDFHDVTSGTSTGSPSYSAAPGYDLVTGRGTPYANLVVAGLVGTTSGNPTTATHFTASAPAGSTAGAPFSVTVTALNANNQVVTGYTGTVHFTSTDGSAVLPANYTFTSGDAGAHTFSVTLKKAGSQTVSVTDTSTGSLTGSAAVSVSPAAATHLAFGQQPTGTTVGAALSPAVTVQVLDAYNNLVTTDSTDKVTVALGNNPGSATLGGTTTVTVSGGVATFGNLSLNQAGTGYTLAASSGTLTGATSAAFNVTATPPSNGTLIEGFETSSTYYVVGAYSPTAYLSTAAAHDGTYGLDDYNGTDWIYRSDAAAQVGPGDSISVWLKLSSAADGRAYFGFGASANGTLSIVAAPNTNQLLLQDNSGWGFTTIGAVSQTYLANHWYRLQVSWGPNGHLTGQLYDSNGTTLLTTVTATDANITSGGIAFRATGHDKYFDTVTANYGVVTSGVKTAVLAGKSGSGTAGPAANSSNALAALAQFFGSGGGVETYFTPAKKHLEGGWLEDLF